MGERGDNSFFSEWGENSPGIWPYDGHTTRAKPLVGTAFNGIVARKMPGEPKRVHPSRDTDCKKYDPGTPMLQAQRTTAASAFGWLNCAPL